MIKKVEDLNEEFSRVSMSPLKKVKEVIKDMDGLIKNYKEKKNFVLVKAFTEFKNDLETAKNKLYKSVGL